MSGDLTRPKSNKGSVAGQFSHEFLHRPGSRWPAAACCAGGRLRFGSIPARGSTSMEDSLLSCQKFVGQCCLQEFRGTRLPGEFERNGNDRKNYPSREEGGPVASL